MFRCNIFRERELTYITRSLYAIARPSVVCLSVVGNVLAPYTQPVKIFGNVSPPFGILAIRCHPRKILRRSSQGNPFVGGFKWKIGREI